jgi:tripartite-type tricarboxylate transporter receptor subunit TctC
MRKLVFAALAFAACFAFAPAAHADTYPSRPITMIVPFPAGGPTDVLARILAEAMRNTLGQPVVIENVTGAGGSIGVGRVVRAAPDGYTLSIGQWETHVLNGATYALQYDLVKDLEPVALLADTPQWIVAKAAMPANDLTELIGWMKDNPGKATVGTVGSAGSGLVAGSYFQKHTGTSFTFVPYRGGAPAIQDLLAGQIDFMFGQAASTLAHVRAGRLKAYAVLAKSRWTQAPDVPTSDEAGVPGLYTSFWHGLWAPKDTPKDVISKLNEAVRAAYADASVCQRLDAIGQEIPPPERLTPEALAAHQKAEIEKWWPIIKAANIKAE